MCVFLIEMISVLSVCLNFNFNSKWVVYLYTIDLYYGDV